LCRPIFVYICIVSPFLIHVFFSGSLGFDGGSSSLSWRFWQVVWNGPLCIFLNIFFPFLHLSAPWIYFYTFTQYLDEIFCVYSICFCSLCEFCVVYVASCFWWWFTCSQLIVYS
jgi:hypothetical protein